jgi:aerobic-type carbon monoxide dehydrogenase small subunit (CoxS/CutS family)
MPTAPASPDAPHAVTVTVNGRPETLRVPARRSLLHALREDLNLTGTKEGCGVGTCGACTVLVDGRPVLACLLLAVQAAGRAVDTIESLSRDGALAPVQQSFIRHDALQCGFCTPGQIMALEGLLRRTPHPSEEALRRALDGNVCRCGTQLRIQAAARELAGR